MEKELSRQKPIGRQLISAKIDPTVLAEAKKHIGNDPDVRSLNELIESSLKSYVSKRDRFVKKMID